MQWHYTNLSDDMGSQHRLHIRRRLGDCYFPRNIYPQHKSYIVVWEAIIYQSRFALVLYTRYEDVSNMNETFLLVTRIKTKCNPNIRKLLYVPAKYNYKVFIESYLDVMHFHTTFCYVYKIPM